MLLPLPRNAGIPHSLNVQLRLVRPMLVGPECLREPLAVLQGIRKRCSTP